MKVIEKGVDRTAYVHVFVHGRVHPLEEYGQYVDARDGAICCYIAVEEDHKIRIDGKFKGTVGQIFPSSFRADTSSTDTCRCLRLYSGWRLPEGKLIPW